MSSHFEQSGEVVYLIAIECSGVPVEVLLIGERGHVFVVPGLCLCILYQLKLSFESGTEKLRRLLSPWQPPSQLEECALVRRM